MFSQQITLENERALLRPLSSSDFESLFAISQEKDLWTYFTYDLSTREGLGNWLDDSFASKGKSQRYPFLIIDKESGKVAGATAFGSFSPRDKRVEIGWTWLGPEFHGTGLNKYCKFLLLQYAFEEMEYLRVELKTDVRNMRSRKAMKKVGAVEEGVLRSHTLLGNGERRDTIYYSFLAYEWSGVKETIFKGIK
ncbi:GNAT family protein [Flammeovirgaceae bacterium SG7u.111]|nr:GNAT family protein [Flammeovirgaceae bacterium SG7u.132]WPO35440.1 GNAT family protein [Flammeovirgaceae bacterium SG7u.111]